MARRKRQLEMEFKPRRGGKRPGAGRPPNDPRGAGVSHLRRPAFPARFPLHVTVRMAKRVWSLRSQRCFRIVERAFFSAGDRFGVRLIHYSVMGNHIHLLVEARDKAALAKAMQGLCVRIARALNRLMRRPGRVFADRYHFRILRTPREVRNVRNYLGNNARKHYGLTIPDPYTSTTAVVEPHTWLLIHLRC